MLNDYELNKAIAKHIHPDLEIAFPGDFPSSSKVRFITKVDFIQPDVDYCNNWNDLLPLLFEHTVTIWIDTKDGDTELEWWGGKEYLGGPVKSCYSVDGKPPQRALAECLLKVLTNES